MELTFERVEAIFSMARTAEYERYLDFNEVEVLRLIFNTLTPDQQQHLEFEAYSVVQRILED